MASVGEVMSRELVILPPTATVGDAVSEMHRRQVGSILVLRDGQLAGIFTERDVVRALSLDAGAPRQALSDWMTHNPQTISPDAPVDDALDLMLERGFRHLPVTQGRELVGMVSMRDLSRAAAEES
ncbi:MAG TPA: CBS domain-containing protein [Candidatus Acidoferrales bacterium]|nr:CBS domain-containing protein [Candidatus Acidoferrales bacterium]